MSLPEPGVGFEAIAVIVGLKDLAPMRGLAWFGELKCLHRSQLPSQQGNAIRKL